MPDAGARPLVLLAEAASVGSGPYAALAAEGRRLTGTELAERLTGMGADVRPIRSAPAEGFAWGAWFAAAARGAVAASPVAVLGYATAGSLALVDDASLATLLAPAAGTVIANNRFSADAFALQGDLERAVTVLATSPSDNAAVRCLADAGYSVTDLSARSYASADVDTPQDLALLAMAGGTQAVPSRSAPVAAFLAAARLPDGQPLAVPRADQVGRVATNRVAELVVAGRISTATAAFLETETACRVRLFVEERGMRAGPGTPRSLLAAWLEERGPADLIQRLATLGDAVVLDTRVLMAAIGRSSDPATWPPAEERFASDFLDVGPIATPWLRELTEAAAASAVPVLLGGHLLLNDGLRILVQNGWQAADAVSGRGMSRPGERT